MKADQRTLPLLVRFAVSRIGNDSLPGCYDENSSVWVVEDDLILRPIVEVYKNLAGSVTKTFSKSERDDTDSSMFLEISTKTEVKPERDDQPESLFMELLELSTKTRVQRERDDNVLDCNQ